MQPYARIPHPRELADYLPRLLPRIKCLWEVSRPDADGSGASAEGIEAAGGTLQNGSVEQADLDARFAWLAGLARKSSTVGFSVCEWECDAPAELQVKTETPLAELRVTAWISAVKAMEQGLGLLGGTGGTDAMDARMHLCRAATLFYWLGDAGLTERCKAFALDSPLWEKAFACNALGNAAAGLACIAQFNATVAPRSVASYVIEATDVRYLRTAAMLLERSREALKNPQGRADASFELLAAMESARRLADSAAAFYEGLYYFFAGKQHMHAALDAMIEASDVLGRVMDKDNAARLTAIVESRRQTADVGFVQSLSRTVLGPRSQSELPPLAADMFPHLHLPHVGTLFGFGGG